MSDGYDSDPRPSSPPARKPLNPIRASQLENLPNSQNFSGSDTGSHFSLILNAYAYS